MNSIPREISPPPAPGETISRQSWVQMPAMVLPAYRAELAIRDGVGKNILFESWGGLGDQICSEPTLRYAIENFKDCNIYLASECPELFHHLPFKRVFDLRDKQSLPNESQFLKLRTIVPQSEAELSCQFFGHLVTHCVDYSSIQALRCQLPIACREVKLIGQAPKEDYRPYGPWVAVHPGRHWQSKTFPKDWWDAVLARLIKLGVVPVIIGANTDDNRGTVDVDTTGCFDLRNELSVMESVWLLQQATCLLTNDSAPLHMTVSGQAWVGFVATAKHPDYIMHWRQGQWGWRQKDFSRGGMWELFTLYPNSDENISVEHVDEGKLRSWLPDPDEFAEWGAQKAK